MTFNFGIPGYQPDWRHGISDIASRHAQRLRGLVGRRLTSTWVVWDDDDDSWFADCPMVLDFDEERLEINHQKFDDISITWCMIDVTRGAAMADIGWLSPAVARRCSRVVGCSTRAAPGGGGAPGVRRGRHGGRQRGPGSGVRR